MSWKHLGDWWLDEIEGDAAYEAVVTPLLTGVLRPDPRHEYLDIGSGDGRVSRAVQQCGARCFGIDVNEQLAFRSGPRTAVAEATSLPIRDRAVDGVMVVLVVEHIPRHESLFAEAARVTRPRGVLALVMNHPAWTAPNSTPITDEDGEVLWRPGQYFTSGLSEMSAGGETVAFHHRTMSSMLNAAARSGWSLEQMVEQPHHELGDQAGIPRLVACRWRLSTPRTQLAAQELFLDHGQLGLTDPSVVVESDK